ncbi:DUF4266 domain-containing protein [Photobacterium chitinilyticum]
MMKQSCYVLAMGTAAMASMNICAADTESSPYQQSESVSSTVYSSQHYGAGLRRNIELVKPTSKSLSLEPVAAATAPESKVNVPVAKPKARVEPVVVASSSQPKTTLAVAKVSSKPAAKTQDESLLSFIDDWLGIKPVKPWQKGTLAKKEMKPGGVVPEFDVFSEKVFSYKQGSVGGNGVGGGGCGCN